MKYIKYKRKRGRSRGGRYYTFPAGRGNVRISYNYPIGCMMPILVFGICIISAIVIVL